MKEVRDEQTYSVIGAAMEVHRQLGHGFLEAVYQETLSTELQLCGIPFQREVELPVFYKTRQLRCGYRADFVCHETVLAETKALARLTTIEEAQSVELFEGHRPSSRVTHQLWRTKPGVQAFGS